MIDRAIRGYVVDFIYIYALDFPVFNIADVCLTLGAALLAGEADFDALCAAGGMESDELGALLIEMEMDGLVTPLAGTRYAPGPQMRD